MKFLKAKKLDLNIFDFITNLLTYDIYEQEWNKKIDNSFAIPQKYLILLEDLFEICQKKEIKIILVSHQL